MARKMPTAKEVFTVPNCITMVRIALIPVFAVLYLKGNLIGSLLVLILSALSDMLDGKIARRFHMVSDIGKWLDPVADKGTQMTLAILLFVRFLRAEDQWMRRFAWVFLLFLAKEVLMLIVGLVMLILEKRPMAAEIYGKIATTVFYVIMILLFLDGPTVGVLPMEFGLPALPQEAVIIMVLIALACTFAALVSYIPDTARKLFGKPTDNGQHKAA
ncbi:MAG: CDP-alcohol phosphatidyltransferase family protein [Oscillospiraceae bacterium]|jgi:cardiolipin synthase|nr:CDP-alcohol phosphatidyltransferase family protein [Oscillospiraceae bacterium]